MHIRLFSTRSIRGRTSREERRFVTEEEGHEHGWITRREFREAIEDLNERINNMADATQADIDALTGQVNQVASDLDAARSSLQAEIDKLAGQGVDVSGLQSALAPVDGAVQALGQLQPSQPAPAPSPSPTPDPGPTPPAPGPTPGP
jgi:hypothetical protein